jgi:hypothetical protein
VVDSQVARLGRRTYDINNNNQGNGETTPGGSVPPASAGSPPAPGGGNGDVDLSAPAFAQQQQGGRQGRGGGGRQGAGGRGRGLQVTSEQCAPIKTAISKNAANQKAYDGLITKWADPAIDRAKTNAELRTVYTKAGVDTALARRCMIFQVGGPGALAGGGRGQGGGGRGARGGGGAGGSGTFLDRGTRTVVTRNGLVFVVPSPGVYEARVIRTGLGSYEFTEVVEGLREGENVAILSAAIIALQQQQSRDKMKQNISSPFGGATPGGGGRGGNPGGGGRGGGGNPGGGGGGRGGGDR